MTALVAAGCSAAPAPSPRPPQRVLVRLDALLPLHPLWATLQQAQRARSLTATSSSGRAHGGTPLTLPSLTQLPDWQTVTERRTHARVDLSDQERDGVLRFALRDRDREDRLLEARRKQYEAEARHLATEAELEQRDAIDRRARERIDQLRDDLFVAQAQAEILQRQDSQANETLLDRTDPQTVAVEVKRLIEAQTRAQLVRDGESRRIQILWPRGEAPRSARVRFGTSRLVVERLRSELEAQVQAIQTEATQQRQQLAETLRRSSQDQIEDRLDRLRTRNESMFMQQETQLTVETIRTAEEKPAQRAHQLPSARPPLALPAPAAPLVHRSLSSPPLTRWEQAVRADLRAAVQDEAVRHGMTVVFDPAPGLPDKTVSFAAWIQRKMQ